MQQPIISRCQRYEELLRAVHDHRAPADLPAELYTLDEHLLLIAQWMKRTKKLLMVKFVSHCRCDLRADDPDKIVEIDLDESGDMIEDHHHGFFPQRLQYLR